jgi:hypothetical protein
MTTPFPERTTKPGAEATTQALFGMQPVFAAAGAKSMAEKML